LQPAACRQNQLKTNRIDVFFWFSVGSACRQPKQMAKAYPQVAQKKEDMSHYENWLPAFSWNGFHNQRDHLSC